MQIQKSFQGQHAEHAGGVLYLVATPIGNLEDITMRALRVLREVDLIAAEDTRHTRKLLSFYEIHSKLKSYHEHNKQESGMQLIEFLQTGGSVALVSDAGMPAISDPGYELVCLAVERELRVVPIPGANAALSALVASALPTTEFTFVGFLPRDKKALRASLQIWGGHRQTLLLYEAPHRLQQTLKAMLAEWGDRTITVARELTKKHEEFWRGTISECLEHVQLAGAKGEFCLIIEGAHESHHAANASNAQKAVVDWFEQIEQLLTAGVDEKTAIRQVAQASGVPKRDVYNDFVRKKAQ
jgi:16S rRNA (cytidine1402-2'-O)-methyltransferase